MGFVLCFPSLTSGQTKNIDCNVKPSTPGTWTHESSQQDGTYVFNKAEAANKIELFKNIKGWGTKGLNARVLDVLLENPDLIPESWKDKKVVFTGSLFKDGGGNPCLRHLYWWDEKWQTGATYPDGDYDDGRVAAVK